MKKSIILIFFLSFFFVCQNVNVDAAWVSNGPPWGPPPNPGDEKANDSIIDGAADFLHSYSQVLLLLKESEKSLKSGFNFSSAQSVLAIAIEKLTSSKDNYALVVNQMKKTSFNKTALQKLLGFDFEKLIEQRKLHPDIMNKVAFYLSKGDILGLYEKMVTDLGDMLDSLTVINNFTRENIPPDIEDLRALFQNYSDFMLMGYYTSLVFDEI